MRETRRRNKPWLVLMLPVLAVLAAGLFLSRDRILESLDQILMDLPDRPNDNRLLIGKLARLSGAVEIPLNPTAEFDGKPRKEIMGLRTAAVKRHPLLANEDYHPCDAVFAQIVDRRPWWGIKGHFVYGPGMKSIEGDSEESRFVLNPYLLVAADFLGISIWNQAFKWDAKKVSEAALNDANFPFHCAPVSLTWWPAESRAEAKYELGKYVAEVNKYAATRVRRNWMLFDITAYNARDMNLNFLYFSPEESEGVSQSEHEKRPVQILHFIHLGGSCQYPGGGNNCSPYQKEMDGFQVDELPARAVFLLWRDQPANVTDTPDMRFTLIFE